METGLQDLRYAVRLLLKSPGFTAVAVLAIALGTGANTAMFSVIDAVLLRSLPFPQPDRLVVVQLLQEGETSHSHPSGDADFLALRDRQRSFEHVAAYAGTDGFALTGMGEPERVPGFRVTADFFSTLGVNPILGRTFHAGDDSANSPPVAVVSQRFWQTHLNSDPAAVGRAITLNGRSFTVIGVMPAGFRFPRKEPNDIWALKTFSIPRGRPPYYLTVLGRLKQGVTPQQAAAEWSAIAAELNRQYPTSPYSKGEVVGLKEFLVGEVRIALLVLLGAVFFVLLIALVNVANLLLARATVREREIAVRRALGASPARIVRQLLTESVLLGLLGGAAGLVLGYWGIDAFLALAPPRGIPRVEEVALNGRVLGFTFLLSLFAGILFGLAPALHTPGSSLNESLKERGRSSSGVAGQRIRKLLVVAEFGLALILVVGAGLLIRSFVRLQHVNPGFDTSHLLTMNVALPLGRYTNETQIAAFWQQLLPRIQALPGVKSAGISMSLPPNLLQITNPFTVEGQPYDPKRPMQLAEEMPISPDYLPTLGVPLLGGRQFTAADKKGSPPVLIINETLAKRHFPGQDPVGKRIQTGDPDPKSPWETIVGVVGDVKYSGLDAEPMPTLYVPYTAEGWTDWAMSMYIAIRTDVEPQSIIPAVRQAIGSLDKDLPVAKVATMDQLLDSSVAEQRFRTFLLVAFAALALLLAAIGIYAVISFIVGQRTHEIGLRIALGAAPAHVLKLVLWQSVALAAVGVTLGLVASLALTRVMTSLLFSVSATDPLSYLAAAVVLTGAAVLASYVPARRATKVDPVVALREE